MVGTMSILGRTGDTRIAWNKDNPDEVAAARRSFDELKAKGFLAFSCVVEEGFTRGTQIHEFDPSAERIILAPPMKGGA